MELEDIKFWATVPAWKTREQAALLLGLDPSDKSALSSSIEYGRYRFILKRAREVRQIPRWAPPRFILEWALSNNLRVNEDVQKIVQSSRPLSDWKKKYRALKKKKLAAKKRMSPKRERTLELMIMVMAIDRYGFIFNGNSNCAAKIYEASKNYDGEILKEQNIRDNLKAAGRARVDEFRKDDKPLP